MKAEIDLPAEVGASRQPSDRPTGAASRRLFRLFTLKRDKSTRRIKLIACGFILIYCIIAGKLIYFGMHPELRQIMRHAASDTVAAARPDILDRNGAILATDIKVTSIFAEPRRIIDRDEAADQLTGIFPDLDPQELRNKLSSRKGFVWVKRAVTPEQQQAVYHLGLPGIGFMQENKRVYPNGPIAAHVLGYANLDGIGISGLEKYIDGEGLADLHNAGFDLTIADLKPVVTSLDLGATYAVREELAQGIAKFKAKAGAAAILDVNTGEVIAMASLPDFDPNNPVDALDPDRINRLSVGVYEMGSTFKALSIAMALDCGKVTLNSQIDARDSLRYGRFTIHDFHAQAPSPLGAGGLYLFVEYSCRADGAHGRRRCAQGIFAQDGTIDALAHRAAGIRRTARSKELGRAEHDDDRFRPGPQCRTASGAHGGRRPGQWRHAHKTDFLEAQ